MNSNAVVAAARQKENSGKKGKDLNPHFQKTYSQCSSGSITKNKSPKMCSFLSALKIKVQFFQTHCSNIHWLVSALRPNQHLSKKMFS
jgi:hypothetical protein